MIKSRNYEKQATVRVESSNDGGNGWNNETTMRRCHEEEAQMPYV